MSSYVLATFCLVGMLALGIGLVLEVRNWRTGRRIISPKQRIIRLLTGVLMFVLFGLVLLGGTITRTSNPISFMFYWMGCFTIGCVVVVLMLLDLREVGNRYREQHREMMRKISEEARRK